MKARNAVVILLTVFCLVALCAASSFAASKVCTVESVGPYGTLEGTDGSAIFLTDTGEPIAFTNKKFFIGPNRGKEFLAAALTALASGKPVTVFYAGTTVTGIYVKK